MRKSLVAVSALLLAAATAVPASAQYWNGYAPGYYAEPGSAYELFNDPDAGRRAPSRDYGYGYGAQGAPAYYGAQGAPGAPAYVDPYANGYGGGGGDADRAGGGYDLGPNANRTTRQLVENPTQQPPGTIVIDTSSRHLYLTEPNGQALEYGIGVGRQGFSWKGIAKVARKAEWPGWTPPAAMLKRRPDLPLHMEGGIENPLGARALYLFNGKGDTGYRIHGTNEPDTIGQAVSSGCIRMMNADVIDLYRRVPVGTRVVVL